MTNEQVRKHFCSFSEAIREGAKLRPQATYAMTQNSRTCALGAGADAIGFEEPTIVRGCYQDLVDLYPYLETRGVACPADHPGYRCTEADRVSLGRLIAHLNDECGWTREAIADWLEREEEKFGYITVVEGESLRASIEVSEMVMV